MKRKFKKVLTLFVSIILLLCLLSGCGSNAEKSIIGKWYNSSGKCLDVRSDSTWKLEDSYGTGTWKLLDDKITFEFTDYYGDTQESLINVDDTGEFIDFGYYGDFYRNTSGNIKNKEANEKTVNIEFFDKNEFKGGVAWVGYTNSNGEKFTCLIDTTGKKLYEHIYNGKIHNDFKGSVSWFYQEDETIALINNSGKIVADSKKNSFDKVVGFGDDVFLVYKNQSTVSEKKHLYTIIDKNGKQLVSSIDLGCEPDEQSRYAGCGIFIIRGYQSEKILFNYKTQKTFSFSTKTDASNINFIDDVACFANTSFASTEEYLALNNNFEQRKIEYFNYVTDGIAVQCNDYMMPKVEHVCITNVRTNKKTKINKYPANQIGKIVFNGEYGTIKILGADGKTYFSLIDREGNFQFEPICCNSASFSDKYLVFKNQDNTYGICDISGKITANNLNESSISKFDNGIALASHSKYIDSTGKEIIMTLK